MSYRCNRCDFHTTDDAAATEHARTTGHYRCIVCRRTSLAAHEPQTCAACVANVRADLADLADGYGWLEPHTIDALTLLGDGTMQRHAHPYELAGGIRDEWPADPFPVIAALASWEDFWRDTYGDPTGPKATLAGVIGYLTTNLDTGHRAAQTHPAFDEFAHEVHRLRAAVHANAGLADVPLAAAASCFDCGGPLLRTYTPATNRGQRRHGFPWEGLTDEWTCGRCRREYSQAEYLLAVRQRHDTAAPDWQPLAVAAWLVDRPFRTVQAWASSLVVRVACHARTHRLLVWMPDVKAMSDDASRRDRSA